MKVSGFPEPKAFMQLDTFLVRKGDPCDCGMDSDLPQTFKKRGIQLLAVPSAFEVLVQVNGGFNGKAISGARTPGGGVGVANDSAPGFIYDPRQSPGFHILDTLPDFTSRDFNFLKGDDRVQNVWIVNVSDSLCIFRVYIPDHGVTFQSLLIAFSPWPFPRSRQPETEPCGGPGQWEWAYQEEILPHLSIFHIQIIHP